MPDAPSPWELKRGIDQVRTDLREDISDMRSGELADIKASVAALSAKLDNLDDRYVSRREHHAAVTRIERLETASEKRSDRTITIWLGIGLAGLSSLVAIGTTVANIVSR